jgi:hypothetical protein
LVTIQKGLEFSTVRTGQLGVLEKGYFESWMVSGEFLEDC